ncbi:L-type lectin-domain containing receptor kinase IX.1-like [Cucumis melo var. makuwa]|uniref:L-type lectin-domain containing receptor kinase IX.1-like n=2 Tax=Cucumis melo TaxID=3656 RepID=A0A5D3CH46_CUCMM|nr:L-type lectin-domain containing receptor kinase IX.1-like [Cucumis melo var. makuwa]
MANFLYVFSMLSHFILFLNLPLSVISVSFKIDQFKTDDNTILYQGDAVVLGGEILLSDPEFSCHLGRAIYKDPIQIWDSETAKLTDFTTHFTFTIDTQKNTKYGQGFAFFLAPSGFQIPPNSAGGFLGLYNKTYSNSVTNQIVHVEFDTGSNDWDPPYEHVGININSVTSSNDTRWNVSLHSGDLADVWISYNSTIKILSVSWLYLKTSTLLENTTLSYPIDLMTVLPQQATVGFSAATGALLERHAVSSWEFNSTLDLKPTSKSTGNNVSVIVGVTVPVGGLILVGIIVFVILWRLKQKKRKTDQENLEEVNLTSINDDLERGAGPRRFSHKLLAMATNNFSNERKLGEGGFGAVYRGYIQDLDLNIAVKKISRGSRQGRKEYITEVKIISRLRHRNLVQLIGWCHDKGEFLLVYEFMSNGSLDSHLFGKRTPLAWTVRYKIVLGLGSALLYLHEEGEQCVVHRDIKSSNIMLDSNFNVKLGDFGLARLMDHELGAQTTGLVGTLGYLAPEYINTGRASKESDVFSFGVVALEIATGRVSRTSMEKESHKGLVEWVWDLYGSGQLLEGVDAKLQSNFDKKQVECLMIVGLWSAYPDPSFRPSIKQVIQVLNFEATVPNLPNKMPIPTYNAPSTSMSSNEPSFTVSLDMGR